MEDPINYRGFKIHPAGDDDNHPVTRDGLGVGTADSFENAKRFIDAIWDEVGTGSKPQPKPGSVEAYAAKTAENTKVIRILLSIIVGGIGLWLLLDVAGVFDKNEEQRFCVGNSAYLSSDECQDYLNGE